jgi:hypothetical protein
MADKFFLLSGKSVGHDVPSVGGSALPLAACVQIMPGN